MKKNDVKIGQCYMAKVTGATVPVRIDAENANGGWDAKNIVSGRKVRIKSAQRLQRKCTQADLAGCAKSAKPNRRATRADSAAEAAKRRTQAATVAKTSTKATKEATSVKGRDTGQPDAKTAKPAKPKRISGLTAAFMVLVDADTELTVKTIVETASEKGWWKSDAATPAATVYAAIIREIATKGDKARFKRGTERGTFRAICTPEQKQELFANKA